MSGYENAGGVGPSASQAQEPGERQGETMATSVLEVKSLPVSQQAPVLAAIETLRQRIAKALGEMKRDQESPRHIEANLRTVSDWAMSGYMSRLLVADDNTFRQAVSDTLDVMDENFQPSLWEARCESLSIPPDAYVDIYEELGLLPERVVAKRVVQ